MNSINQVVERISNRYQHPAEAKAFLQRQNDFFRRQGICEESILAVTEEIENFLIEVCEPADAPA